MVRFPWTIDIKSIMLFHLLDCFRSFLPLLHSILLYFLPVIISWINHLITHRQPNKTQEDRQKRANHERQLFKHLLRCWCCNRH